ncbi:MAG: DUF2330 domain-containing protein [Armatimonadota bacterium]|jgi:hypothetical protein
MQHATRRVLLHALRNVTYRASVVMWLLIVTGLTVMADGGYFPVFEGVAETADQRAIVIDHGNAQTIVLQTGYDGDASEFAWVIPLPTRIAGATAVSTADPAIFETLHDLTAPRYLAGYEGSSGICGCAGAGGGTDGSPTLGGVTVWDSFSVDRWDVAVLSAQESGELATWLNDNGYAFGTGDDAMLAYYVNKGWYFVAFKISPHADTGGGGGGEQFRPLSLTFATGEPVFPMRISGVSTTRRVEVLIYVLSAGRVEAKNYTTAPIKARSIWSGSDFDTVYDGWFEETIADAGGRALVVEYAGAVPQWWVDRPPFDAILQQGRSYYVTRMRTRLTPEQMTEDIVIGAAAERDDLQVVAGSGMAALRGRLALAALLLAGVQGVALRRWRFGGRFASATALLGILMVLL